MYLLAKKQYTIPHNIALLKTYWFMPNAFTGSIKTVHAGFSIKILAPSRGPEVLNCRAARTTPDSKLFLAWLANVIDILDYNFTILGDKFTCNVRKKNGAGVEPAAQWACHACRRGVIIDGGSNTLDSG